MGLPLQGIPFEPRSNSYSEPSMRVTALMPISCILASAFTSMALAAGDADGHGPLAAPTNEKPAEPTLSERYGTWFVPPSQIVLEAMDTQGYLKEDANTDPSQPYRFAIERALDFSLSDGQWIDVEGGRLWRLDIVLDGAMSSRLHLSGLNLAEGQELAIVNPELEEQMTGVLSGTGDFLTGEAFGICAPTTRTRIEWFVPTGHTVQELPFDSAADAFGYRDVFGMFDQLGGTCSLNPACYAAWLNESNATAKLTFTSGGGGYLCSSQLVATTAADETPYVSTANHCISTTAEANSAAFIFFYRSACTGGNSAGTTVSGADLTVGYGASDCTLLMARGTLPTGVYWAGWTNTNPATSTASTGLHHPSGTAQAISFGVKNSASFNCGSPAGNWNSLSWTNGITEGGSSGSAIYRDSDHKMYGVLTCGASSCANPAADDGYGRWDLAVASGGFASPLAAGSDDAQEPNDACATPRILAAGTYTGLIVKRLDEDWYSLNVPVGQAVTGTFTYTHSNGDIDVDLYSACGTTAVLVRNGNVNNETLSYTNPGPSTTLLMRVYLSADTRNDYSMTMSWTTPAPVNDNCAAATAVGAGSFAFDTTYATTTALALPTSCDEGGGVAINKDVWFRYTAACTGNATASTCGTAIFDTRIAVYAGGACPGTTTPVSACSDNGAGCASSSSSATWAVTAGSTWYVRVGAPAATSGSGTLAMSCVAVAQCPADLDHDLYVDGADLGMLLGGWGSAQTDVNGDLYTDGADLGIMLGAWGACP